MTNNELGEWIWPNQIDATATIDVETVHGWVRLELTRDQAMELVRELGETL